MKNDVNKKTIFVHKIHDWLNFTLNDLSKSINIFNVSSNWKLEKIENEITCQINKNKKQSDYTNMNWKNWIREIFACSQNFRIWSFELFLRHEQTNVKICSDELLSDVKKKRNLMDNEWRNKKLSSFNDYFQNNENVDKMIHQNGFIVNVFIDQKSAVLKKFEDKKI